MKIVWPMHCRALLSHMLGVRYVHIYYYDYYYKNRLKTLHQTNYCGGYFRKPTQNDMCIVEQKISAN